MSNPYYEVRWNGGCVAKLPTVGEAVKSYDEAVEQAKAEDSSIEIELVMTCEVVLQREVC